MRRLPWILALLWVTVSLVRIGQFLADGLKAGFVGWITASVLLLSVYVGGYWLRNKQTRRPAIAILATLGIADLFLNEVEYVRVLSAAVLVVGNGDFLGLSAVTMRHLIQWAALLVGGLQTIAAAELGWLQGAVDTVGGKRGAVQVAEKKMADYAEEKTASGTRRNFLTAAQKEEIAAMAPRQIVARYGGSKRRAREWKQAARDGKL